MAVSTRTRPTPPTQIRVLPAPRTEPMPDDEFVALGLDAPPMTAPLLPLDLPTGARVRRTPRPGGEPGAPAGDGAPPLRGEAARAGTAAGVAVQSGVTPLRPSISTSAMPSDAGSTGVITSVGQPSDPGHRSKTANGLESAEAIELRQSTRLLLATCVEVVGGYRPIGQLRPFCLPERFDAIVNRLLRPTGGAGRGHGATRASVVAGHGGPPRAGRSARTGPGDRVTVRRVQICDVSDGVAEIAVVMARRDKVWAMAVRMELARGRWLCTHLEVL